MFDPIHNPIEHDFTHEQSRVYVIFIYNFFILK